MGWAATTRYAQAALALALLVPAMDSGASEQLDVLFAVDVSEAMARPSGTDVDGDGKLGGKPRWLGLARVEDPGDSILAAQLELARDVVDRVAGEGVRFGFIRFSSDAETIIPLTDYAPSVHQALALVSANRPAGKRQLANVFKLATSEFKGRAPGKSSVRKNARKVVVVFSDGRAGTDALTLNQERALKAASALAKEGVRVDVYGAPSLDRGREWSFFSELAGQGRGYFSANPTPVLVAENLESEALLEARTPTVPAPLRGFGNRQLPEPVAGCLREPRFPASADTRVPSALMIAIDKSGSTRYASGIDVDADDFTGETSPTIPSTDTNDSTLALEIQLVCSLVASPVVDGTRVGLIDFSAPFDPTNGKLLGPRDLSGRVVAPLGTDRAQLELELERIAKAGSSGATDLSVPVIQALRALADGDHAIPGSEILLLTDGRPSAPHGSASVADPEDLEVALQAARIAGAQGVPVHVLLMGTPDRETEQFAAEFSGASGGRFEMVFSVDEAANVWQRLLGSRE